MKVRIVEMTDGKFYPQKLKSFLCFRWWGHYYEQPTIDCVNEIVSRETLLGAMTFFSHETLPKICKIWSIEE